MSTTRETTLWCDADGCVQWEQVAERTDAGARRELRGLGWKRASGKDYCPFHADPKRRSITRPAVWIPGLNDSGDGFTRPSTPESESPE
jgi:hypothetical protein